MADKLPSIVNYLIGIALMVFVLYFLKKKSIEQPHMKFAGLSIKTISILVYVGIALYTILIIAILTGAIRR